MSNSLVASDRGKLFVISAPAGTGKTTLVKMVCDEFDEVVASVSCTTRDARPSEEDGVHYHVLSQEAFQEICNRHRASFFNLAYHLTKRRDQAEDIVQDAYLRALSRYPDDEEMQIALSFINDSEKTADGVQSLLWALVNTKEFIITH